MDQTVRPTPMTDDAARQALTELLIKSPYPFPMSVLEQIMAWHRQFSPQPPTREAVEAVVRPVFLVHPDIEVDKMLEQRRQRVVDDLLALFHPTPTPWCRHIVWRDLDRDISTFSGYVFIGETSSLECLNEANDARTWDICPVKDCHAARPREDV